VVSACPVSHGGLGIALAKAAVAGRLGMEVTIPAAMRPDYFLFSESLGRFVVTVAPDNKRAFEQALGQEACLLGRVTAKNFRISAEKLLVDLPVHDLEAAYKGPFGGY
jgi:phosphoribosylformylglycinamidine synthase